MKNNGKLPVIVLAGFSCAGKSTISKRLASLCGFDLIDQHIVYKEIANAKGYERARYWLADVGSEVFIRATTLENVRRINDLKLSNGVIIDASCGPLMHNLMNSDLINARVINIAVTANEDLRIMRIVRRMACSDEEARTELFFRDSILSEWKLEKVMKEADFRVVNEDEIDHAVGQRIDWPTNRGIVKPLCN